MASALSPLPPTDEHDQGFDSPAWDSEVDVAGLIAATPANKTTRGLFMNRLGDAMVDAGVRRPRRWVAFQNYPSRDYIRLLADCAEAQSPDLPLGRALRKLGRSAYTSFAESTIGKVMFAFAGRDPRAALRLAPKAYEIATNGSSEVTHVAGDGVDYLYMRRLYSYPEFHEVGAIEGGVQAFGAEAKVSVRVLAHGDVDVRIEWR